MKLLAWLSLLGDNLLLALPPAPGVPAALGVPGSVLVCARPHSPLVEGTAVVGFRGHRTPDSP